MGLREFKIVFRYSKRSSHKHFCHIGRIKVWCRIQITRAIRAPLPSAYTDFKVYCTRASYPQCRGAQLWYSARAYKLLASRLKRQRLFASHLYVSLPLRIILLYYLVQLVCMIYILFHPHSQWFCFYKTFLLWKPCSCILDIRFYFYYYTVLFSLRF